MADPLATTEGSVHVWKREDGDRRPDAPAEHTSFKIEKGTKLSEVVAAMSAAGVDNDAVAGFAVNTITKARRVAKARRATSDAFRKAQSFTVVSALELIVDRAASRAVAKAQLAERYGTAVPTTEVEQLSAALHLMKAKHSVRHPFNGKFVAAGKPTPGPDSDMFGGAQTEPVIPGTGSPAATPPNPAFPVKWNHLGPNNLLG